LTYYLSYLSVSASCCHIYNRPAHTEDTKSDPNAGNILPNINQNMFKEMIWQ